MVGGSQESGKSIMDSDYYELLSRGKKRGLQTVKPHGINQASEGLCHFAAACLVRAR
jgi:hypothetical protein